VNPYIQLANDNKSKQMFVRLIFVHLAWQQFLALLFCAVAWDRGFQGEPMAMWAPEMFENNLDGMCLIFFPIVLIACRLMLHKHRILFWLLHLIAIIQAFAWVGAGQMLGYGRVTIVAAVTTLGSTIVAGLAAYAPAEGIVQTMKTWRFCLILYSGTIFYTGISCLICSGSLVRPYAFVVAWALSTMWICSAVGTVRNVIDRVYSNQISLGTGLVLLDMYQWFTLELVFNSFKAAIECKNIARVVSYYPVNKRAYGKRAHDEFGKNSDAENSPNVKV
jgi:hypothetical protein